MELNTNNKNMENINFSPSDIARYTGQSNISGFSKVSTPMLQLDSKTGDYSIIQNKEEFNLGNAVQGVVIKVRKCMQYFPDGGAYSLSTGEGENNSIVPLWVRQPNKELQTPMRGTFAELKAKYSMLKMCPVLYIVLEGKGELVKFIAKGKVASNLFGYYGVFDKTKDEHLHQYITEFSTVKEGYNGKEYWTAVFTKGEKVKDEMAIIMKAKELTESLENAEMQFSQTKTTKEKEPEADIDINSMFEN